MESYDVIADDIFELNVTTLEPKLKHPTIFNHFDALQPGEAFYILNDHDPKPLYYQMIATRGTVFTWRYVEEGPLWWKVLIRKNTATEEPGIGELAAADVRKAEVFKKYGLDFCCGGKKSLKQACAEKNLDATVIEKELLQATQVISRSANLDFNRWQPDFLTDYIYNQHHQYWYDEEPVITDLVDKVTSHHGQNFPFLIMLKEMFTNLRMELNSHFMKEERVLFPHIKELVKAQRLHRTPETVLQDINEPLDMMEAEHEAAGDLLRQIRQVTSNYTLPSGACNSFGLLYHKLKGLEEDLHQHIHLENNILFPKAASLHKQLIK